MSSSNKLPCVDLSATIREAVEAIDFGRKGISLLIDSNGRLTGALTDGDIRRALLAGISLGDPVEKVQRLKASYRNDFPICAPVGTAHEILITLMQDNSVLQIPLIDSEGRPVELISLDDLLPENKPALQAVIMAGGFGSRLSPLTDDTPKPMLPVGDRPLMEHVVDQLRRAGIKRINISTHFKPEKIVEHFGDGKEFGVEVCYVSEDRPLGTAGALSLLNNPSEPLLVLNGDILTAVDYGALAAYHRGHNASLTVGVRKYEFTVPYGVVEHQGPMVRKLSEKPTFDFFVNAGIYLLEPKVLKYITHNQRLDMPDLIHRLIGDGMAVVSFPIHEYWLDIGRHDDYKQAQQDVEKGIATRRAA